MPDEFAILTPASMRSQYVTLTDKLIHRIESHDDVEKLHLLFLDKSARPVAWFVRALWPILARVPGTEFSAGCVPPIPRMSFANIDREQWWSQTGASEVSNVDVSRVPLAELASFRGAFLRSRPNSKADVWEMPAWLDGRSVLVVDEVSVTGDTLRIAEGLTCAAFPTAMVSSTHWMTPGSKRDGSGLARVADVPVWYRSDSVEGRLVGNRLASERKGAHWRGSVGALFMSTVPPVADAKGVRLRREVAQVAQDVADGSLLAAPSSSRDIDEIIDRIESLYGYSDPRMFTDARLAQ